MMPSSLAKPCFNCLSTTARGDLTAVGSEDLLASEGEPRSLARPGGLDSLEPDPSHRALGHRGPFLQVLEHEPSARRPGHLAPVAARVVAEAAPVCDALNHLIEQKAEKYESTLFSGPDE